MCRIDFGHIQKNMITTIELIDMALCFVCVCVLKNTSHESTLFVTKMNENLPPGRKKNKVETNNRTLKTRRKI